MPNRVSPLLAVLTALLAQPASADLGLSKEIERQADDNGWHSMQAVEILDDGGS